MKAVGYYLIVEKEKQGTQKTNGGLLLAENAREDIRYAKGNVVSVGNDIVGVTEGDHIYYDKHAGHSIEIDNKVLQVIKVQDVVVIL
jgi:co-chaperonin GroES (HSP10)